MSAFIVVTSDYGRIGPFFWANSATAPVLNPVNLRMERYWGAVAWNPEPGVRYTEVAE